MGAFESKPECSIPKDGASMPNTTMRKLELKNFTSEQKKFRTVHGKLLLELSIGRLPNEGRTNITQGKYDPSGSMTGGPWQREGGIYYLWSDCREVESSWTFRVRTQYERIVPWGGILAHTQGFERNLFYRVELKVSTWAEGKDFEVWRNNRLTKVVLRTSTLHWTGFCTRMEIVRFLIA